MRAFLLVISTGLLLPLMVPPVEAACWYCSNNRCISYWGSYLNCADVEIVGQGYVSCEVFGGACWIADGGGGDVEDGFKKPVLPSAQPAFDEDNPPQQVVATIVLVKASRFDVGLRQIERSGSIRATSDALGAGGALRLLNNGHVPLLNRATTAVTLVGPVPIERTVAVNDELSFDVRIAADDSGRLGVGLRARTAETGLVEKQLTASEALLVPLSLASGSVIAVVRAATFQAGSVELGVVLDAARADTRQAHEETAAADGSSWGRLKAMYR